jgi:TonB family protein
MKNWRKFAVGVLLALAASPVFVSARRREPVNDPAAQTSAEKSGSVATKPGLCLYLNADPGNVQILTDESEHVSYHVVADVDPRVPGAEDFLRQFTLNARQVRGGVSLDSKFPWREFRGRFGVSLEIRVPRRYNLEINTQGGNISVRDIEGQVDLTTAGGTITVGRVGTFAKPDAADAVKTAGRDTARLVTQGGHIVIGDVAGTLTAETSGGNIVAGDISGDANLHTGGGQIQTGRIAGVAKLETGGGDIRVKRSGPSLTADTAGGQINLSEASGAIQAHTGGGAVQIEHVTGPTVLESDDGNIFLKQVEAQIRASTGSGTVTAWLGAAIIPENAAANAHALQGESQFTSNGGDVVVYFPRHLAATIDAVVERSGWRRIIADPSLPLTISDQDSESGPGTIRYEGKLNGGGNLLHVKAVGGNIILKHGEPHSDRNNPMHAAWMPADPESAAMQAWNFDDGSAGFFDEVRRRILESWWGGVPVDADEMQKHLEHAVPPVYPDVARRAGVEGDVVLRVFVSSEGRVTNLEVLEGPPILARAAVEAVQRWQYQSLRINGHPASVVTTMVVAFRLK